MTLNAAASSKNLKKIHVLCVT